MKKIFLIIGISFFILLAISSCVANKSVSKKKETQNSKIKMLYEESSDLINKGELKEAQEKLETIINIDPKNSSLDWAYDLHDYLTMVIEDVAEFPIQASNLSDDELKQAKEGKLFKRYTDFDQLNVPLNKKINAYVKKNYNTIKKNKEKSQEYEEKMLKEQEKTERIRKFVNSYDDSYRPLVEYVKQNMNDPKSYEHVKSLYDIENDKTVTIETTFRGKNKLGALVINRCRALAVIDTGELLEVKCE